MNKIPFTSQNPYAFYAKTIDSYDTETNTREAKKREKNKTQESLKEDRLFFFFFLLSANGKHLFG